MQWLLISSACDTLQMIANYNVATFVKILNKLHNLLTKITQHMGIKLKRF